MLLCEVFVKFDVKPTRSVNYTSDWSNYTSDWSNYTSDWSNFTIQTIVKLAPFCIPRTRSCVWFFLLVWTILKTRHGVKFVSLTVNCISRLRT